jgi:hypothetical protein
MNVFSVRRWWLAALLCGAGCGRHAQPELTGAHALPHHHPRTFHRAVDVLGGDTLTPAERRDVIRWLPELAADTSLGRERWEQVTRLSAALAAADSRGPAADGPLAALREIDTGLPPEDRRDDGKAPDTEPTDGGTTGSEP